MKRLIGLVAALVVIGVATAGALDFTVSYVEGSVEANTTGSWQSATVGTRLSGTDRVRLRSGDFLELSRDGRVVRLSRPGEYSIDNLPEVEEPATRIGSAIGGLLRALIFEREFTDTTTAGARASEAAAEPEVDWAGGTSTWDLVQTGLEYLADGDVEEAFFEFDEAYMWAEPEEMSRIGFYYAFAASQIGERDLAQDVLAEIPLQPDEYWYGDARTLQAELLLEDGDAEGAETAAAEAEAVLAADPDASPAKLQVARFLLGEALTAQGRTGDARAAYTRAIDAAPESALAAAARERT